MEDHRGRYEGKYLPHLDAGELTQFITFRLADSIPREAMARLEEELTLIKTDRELERKRRIEKLLDGGAGSCILRESQCAEIVRDSILFLDQKRYSLRAYVVMPNHVHMLARFDQGQSLAAAMHSLKSYTSNSLGKLHPEIRPIWQEEYFDRYMRSEDHFHRTLNYIEQNPVKANLCKSPEEFPWSSAFGRSI